LINNLDIDDFLKNYWQKKPFLIRAAFPDYQPPISAEELAGLACEDFVESRIILENFANKKWHLENGPFAESRFPELPESHWTLLIQGLNKIFPELDDLLHQFNFIPSWRVDDLMASYAAPQGSVGPHVDQYDVFLLQASGRRKWMISEESVKENNFETDIPLKIIKNFKAESEWILEAGDMLYLPANVAHYGIAMEDCMTFSIGFRAPSHAELLSAYVDDHITELNENLRYQDPDLSNKKIMAKYPLLQSIKYNRYYSRNSTTKKK
jgi:50S ribosomal protein L16 3-hydroxylase